MSSDEKREESSEGRSLSDNSIVIPVIYDPETHQIAVAGIDEKDSLLVAWILRRASDLIDGNITKDAVAFATGKKRPSGIEVVPGGAVPKPFGPHGVRG